MDEYLSVAVVTLLILVDGPEHLPNFLFRRLRHVDVRLNVLVGLLKCLHNHPLSKISIAEGVDRLQVIGKSERHLSLLKKSSQSIVKLLLIWIQCLNSRSSRIVSLCKLVQLISEREEVELHWIVWILVLAL